MEEAYHFMLLILTIGFIILSGSYFKWHPFLSLLVSTIGFGLLAGIPVFQIITSMSSGFGNLLGAIGLIVVMGSILGTVLEESGSVQRLGVLLQSKANRNPSLGIAFLGMILGIPVFCDSGFIVLVSLAKSIAVTSHIPLPTMTLSLSSGLYTTHTLVPPTPGPVAAAGNLGISSSMGLIIILGIIVSIPVVLVAHIYAKRMGNRLPFEGLTEQVDGLPKHVSVAKSIILLVLPMILIAMASLLDLFYSGNNGVFMSLKFLGNPIMALLLTVSVSLIFFDRKSNATRGLKGGFIKRVRYYY